VTQVMLVGRNRGYAAALRSGLEVAGYAVTVADRPAPSSRDIRQGEPDAVLLELSEYPDFDTLAAIRSAAADVPILVLSSWREDAHKRRAFELGADDYVTKPFAMPTLLAHIKALLRRVNVGERAGPSWIRVGELLVYPPGRLAERDGKAIRLRPKEYDLLMALLRRRGTAVSREDLLREVWRRQPSGCVRTVDVHVALLRRRVERNSATPRHILTVHCKGYMLARARER
jgi:two-component system, OmpR family, alkaline phosphatase synthesis response regulator PhoP